MEILKFVSSLLPSLERVKILEDLEITDRELNETVIPAFRSTLDVNPFKIGFKAKWPMQFQKDWSTHIRLQKRGDTYLHDVYAILQELPKRLEWINREIRENFSEDLSTNGITYPKANLLALLQAIGFAVKYSRKLLLATYGFEMEHLKGVLKAQAFSRAELKMLDDQAFDFIRVMAILSRQDLARQIEHVPEIVVDAQDTNGAIAAHGPQLDPTALGFLPYRWNPIYHIRLKIAEWQHARYESAKAERQAIELRLIALQNQRNGTKNPSIEKQIQYYDDQLKDLNYKIAKMEE